MLCEVYLLITTLINVEEGTAEECESTRSDIQVLAKQSSSIDMALRQPLD